MTKDKDVALTVVQHNDLLTSSYRLNLDEMRLLNLALTKINSKHKNIGKIEIYPEEFAQMHNVNPHNVWRNMKNSVIGLMKKPIKMQFVDEKGRKKERLLSWLDEAVYYVSQDDSSKIEIEFSRKIEPYLFELKGNFTKIDFEQSSRLTTPFSFRLYQWLVDAGKYKGVQFELVITLDEMRSRAHLGGDAYPRWSAFKEWVIDPAVEAINNKTNLELSYEITRLGRKIHSITFTCADKIKMVMAEGGMELSDLKPERPVLKRRPHVTKGSHEEGEWQKSNLKLLRQYQTDLKNWDSTARLAIRDLQKLIDCSRLFATETHENAVLEMTARKRKK